MQNDDVSPIVSKVSSMILWPMNYRMVMSTSRALRKASCYISWSGWWLHRCVYFVKILWAVHWQFVHFSVYILHFIVWLKIRSHPCTQGRESMKTVDMRKHHCSEGGEGSWLLTPGPRASSHRNHHQLLWSGPLLAQRLSFRSEKKELVAWGKGNQTWKLL